MEKQDYYQVLGIDKGADPKRIKNAYRKLAFEYHPDRNLGKPEAAARMKHVNEAYAVLSDPDKRRRYDALGRQFGDTAHSRFRESYSEQDIFKGSDIHQVFEEMARSFGFRGVDEIFKEFYGPGYRKFDFKGRGGSGGGFFFFGGFGRGPRGLFSGGLEKLTKLLMGKMGAGQLPEKGEDLQDVIHLGPDLAANGGPYAYFHRAKSKKLVVKIPPGIKNRQKIRLSGMGNAGKWGGVQGDLYLEVRIKTPILDRLKRLIGKKDSG